MGKDGGRLLHRVELRAQAEPLRRLVPLVLGATWAPLIVVAAAEQLATGRAELLVRDLSVHARLLVAVPIFLLAERLLDRVAGVTLARLREEGNVPPASTPELEQLLARVTRWRDSPWPQLVLVAVAATVGVATLAGVMAPAGSIHGVDESGVGPVRVWYALVSLPLFQLLLGRALFRWGLWVRILVGLCRLPLRLRAAHADRCAGIGFVKLPTVVYWSLMLLAGSAVLCASWATRMRMYGAPLSSFRPLFAAFVLIGLALGCGPLLLFVPSLVRARIVGLRQFGGLVSDYTERFARRWLERADRAELLGTPDIQSFNDLGTAYRENLERMRLILLAPGDWMLLLVAALLPAVPLLFLQQSVSAVLERVLRLLVGGAA